MSTQTPDSTEEVIGDADIDPEQAGEYMETTTITLDTDDGPLDLTLGDVMSDILVGHMELSQYREGALVMCDGLDDRIQRAKQNDHDQLVAILEQVRESAFLINQRVAKGDDTILGEESEEAPTDA